MFSRNVYTCPHGHATWTEDVDEGTTPFMIPCQTEHCPEAAESSFYRISSDPQPVTHEWYRPRWWATLFLDINDKEHVRSGGLLLRPVA